MELSPEETRILSELNKLRLAYKDLLDFTIQEQWMKSQDFNNESENAMRKRWNDRAGLPVQMANFQKFSNDLIWDIQCHERVRWTGYNDQHWWNEVSTKPGYNRSECRCGKCFEINFRTREVKEVLPKKEA